MMDNLNDFPFIKQAALDMAHDSGIIHRELTEENFFRGVEACVFADGVYEPDLKVLNDWLSSLSPEDFTAIVCGEHSEMLAVAKKSPKNDEGFLLVDLFDDIFNYDYKWLHCSVSLATLRRL